jgi:ADP-heptose:LPS heptosyltransferase
VDWSWHVVEGLAEHLEDTAWCREAGGSTADFQERSSPLSTDGTSGLLDGLQREFGPRLRIHRPPGPGPWPGKKAMIDSLMGELADGCLLWQLDVDEFWRPEMVREILGEFGRCPDLTAAWFDCDYFFGWDRCSSQPEVFGNFREFEWLRVWRYRMGDRWESHEPPALMREVEGGRREDVGRIHPLKQETTRARGWKFQHYAMTDRAQMAFKEAYYGHRGLTAGLEKLNRAGKAEPLARRLFPHVREKEIGTARTFRTFWKNLTEPLQPGARPRIARQVGVVPIAQTDVRGCARFVFATPASNQPASVLLLRSDRIGDQILFLPFLASLRRQLPFTQIHLAVPEDVAPIYRLWGEVDRLHTFRRDEGHQSANYRQEILQRLPAAVDWVILPAFNGEKLSFKLASGIRAKRKVAFDGEFRGLKSRHRAKYRNIATEHVAVPDPDLHELEKYRLLLRHLGLQPEIEAPLISRPVSAGGSPRRGRAPRLLVAMGTVNPIKEYPHWKAVVAELEEKIRPEWVLIGGGGDEGTPGPAPLFAAERTRDLRGKTSLEALAGEIVHADLFLGVDTGPAHLALALGVPTVVILGGGDYGRFFPYGKSRVVLHRMECFQCHWECRFDRALCLHEISPRKVVQEVLAAGGFPE